MFKKTNKIVLFFIGTMIFPIILGWVLPTWADVCPEMEKHYQSALRSNERIMMLKQVVDRCPDHVRALNDLALAYEDKNQLTDAELFYKKAIQADPDFPPPYAGLGDVLVATHSPRQAVNAYKGFLRLLMDWKNKGDPENYSRYESIYRKRLADIVEQLSSNQLVSADTINRSLSRSFVGGMSRNIGVVPIRAEIDLSIHFNFGSAALLPEVKDQLDQVAKALKKQNLIHTRMVIEGHTDSVGSDQKNEVLSKQRADAVRKALISRGINAKRLESLGRGKSFPVADNNTDSGRALNRRVTFVNMGQM